MEEIARNNPKYEKSLDEIVKNHNIIHGCFIILQEISSHHALRM